jgi:hypothetical protein
MSKLRYPTWQWLLREQRNGLKSEQFCKFVYDQGLSTNPDMTLSEMQENVETLMNKLKLSEQTIQNSRYSYIKSLENDWPLPLQADLIQ